MQRPLAKSIPLATDGSDFPPALRENVLALLDQPDGPRMVADVLVRSAKADQTLMPLAEAAIALRGAFPMDRAVWGVTDQLVYSQVPNWHWSMLRDKARTRAFQEAINTSVEPGMCVLEIGAGTGVLAMMAARAGAGHVYTVEANPLLARIAGQCIARNGLSEQITVLPMHSTEMTIGRDIPRRGDLLVHEILSSAVLGEGVAPTLHHAKAHLLELDAPLLPEFIGIEAVLSEEPTADQDAWWQVEGFDLGPLAVLDASAHGLAGNVPRRRLSKPLGVAEFDLRSDDLMQARRFSGPLEVSRAGVVAGVEQWMKVCFPGGVVLTSDDRFSHWGTCYHPFGAFRKADPGDKIDIEITIDGQVLSIGLPTDSQRNLAEWTTGV